MVVRRVDPRIGRHRRIFAQNTQPKSEGGVTQDEKDDDGCRPGDEKTGVNALAVEDNWQDQASGDAERARKHTRRLLQRPTDDPRGTWNET